MPAVKANDFASLLKSLDKDKLIRIYLNNNVCILTEPKHLEFFDDYCIYDGKSANGTMYFPDPEKLYPKHYDITHNVVPHMNIVPYSSISLITDTTDLIE